MGQRVSRATAAEVAGVALTLVVVVALLLLAGGVGGGGGGNGPPTPPVKRMKPGLYYINGHLQQTPWSTFADAIEACYTASEGAAVATEADVAACKDPSVAKPHSPAFVASGRAVEAGAKQTNVPKYIWDAPLPEYVYLKVYPKTQPQPQGAIQLVTMQFSKAVTADMAYLGAPSNATVSTPGPMTLEREEEALQLYRIRHGSGSGSGSADRFSLVVAQGPLVGSVLFAMLVPNPKTPASAMLQHAAAPDAIPPANLATTVFTQDAATGNVHAVAHTGGATKSPLFIDGTLPGAVYTPFATPSKVIKSGHVMATKVTLSKVQF